MKTQFNELNAGDINQLKDNVYVSSEGVVSYDNFDIFNEIGLITAGTGRGKTTFVLDTGEKGLLRSINKAFGLNIKPEEMLFLSPRTAINMQQQHKHQKTATHYSEYDYKQYDIKTDIDKGKIRMATAHKFGQLVRDNKIEIYPKLVVVDELHTVFSETVFAEDLFYTCKFLEEDRTTIKVGLTATPDFLQKYIAAEVDINFKVINRQLNTKYTIDNITIINNGSVETYMQFLKYDNKNKVIVFTRNAKDCYNLSKQYPNAAFLISQHSEAVDKDTGELLKDIMLNQPYLNHVLTTGTFPEGIDILFINNAYREGLDLHDSSVDTVKLVCEATDLTTLLQVIGRFRQTLEELVVINNNRYRSELIEKIEDTRKFIESIANATSKEEEWLLTGARIEQQKNKYVPKFAFIYKGKTAFNLYAKAFYEYQIEHYNIMQRTSDYSKYYCNNERIDNRREFFTNALKGYLTPISYYNPNRIVFINGSNLAEEAKIIRMINSYSSIDKYLNRKLTKKDKNELCAALNIRLNRGRLLGWTLLKEHLVKAGFKVEDKRNANERYTVISK